MLCYFCITENRSEPNKHVTFVQGTAVCQEHAAATSKTPAKLDSPEVVAVLQKLKELADRVKQQRAATNGTNNGTLTANAVVVDADDALWMAQHEQG